MVDLKHILLYLSAIYFILFIAFVNKYEKGEVQTNQTTLRVFGYSSFTNAWGAGPVLKESFEKTCQCKIDFIEGTDSGILLQRLKIEGASLGADLVIGLDQFDLQQAMTELKWEKLNFNDDLFDPALKGVTENSYFVPFDWGVLTFMTQNADFKNVRELDELLGEKFNKKIALQDPRTSSPGFQFLWWVIKLKGEKEGFDYLKKMLSHAHSYSSSWSTSIGLYQKGQAEIVFSYTTSPLYYLLEENNNKHGLLDIVQPKPMQVEFMGIPSTCTQCELAEKFVNFILSPEGQKIIMTKNYMLPVLKGVREGTPFADDQLTINTLPFEIPSHSEVQSLIKRWTDLRRLSN